MAVFFSLSYDPEIRVYIEDPATEEINVFKSCEGITVTSKEEAADYVVTIESRELRTSSRLLDRLREEAGKGSRIDLSVATADGDFIFAKYGSDLYDLILDACEAIHRQ